MYTKEQRDLYNKEYYLKHKIQILEYKSNCRKTQNDKYVTRDKKDRTLNFERYMYRSLKSRCKRSNIDFNLTLEDVIIPDICPFLNIEITRTIGQGKVPSNPSFDRIDPTKGYIKDNVQIISDLANTMKSNATREQLIAFAQNVLLIYK